MRSNQSSLTAMGTAAQRALEMEKPVDERICNDPFARQFIPGWFYFFMKIITSTRYAQQHASGDLGFIVARCRYMDDILCEALAQGIQQLVILGAGFDSRALRFTRLQQGVRVFEVDHPATQKNKQKKLKHIFGEDNLPVTLNFVPVDFSRETLASRMVEYGYSEQLKTLFIWEGVTMCLDASSVDSTLAFIAGHSPPGSEIIFDYMVEKAAALPKRDFVMFLISSLRNFSDEVRSFKIETPELESFLFQRGFSGVCNITAAELQARYFTGRNVSRKITSGYAIALGKV